MKTVLRLSSFLLALGLLLGLYQAVFPSGGRAAQILVFFPAPSSAQAENALLQKHGSGSLEKAKASSAKPAPFSFARLRDRLQGLQLFFSGENLSDPAGKAGGQTEGKTLIFSFDKKSRGFIAAEVGGKSSATAEAAPQDEKSAARRKPKQSAFLEREIRRLRPFLEKYKEQSVWTVSLRKEAKTLQALYPSKKPLLKRRFPAALHIYMKDRLPIFLLLNASGRFYPVFSQGEIGAAIPFAALTDLPVARGKALQKDRGLRRQAARLLTDLPEGGLFSPSNMSEIFYKSKRFLLFLSAGDFALEIRLPLQKGARKNINFVLNYLMQKNETGALINAERPEKIIVRRKKRSSETK